MGLFCVNVTKLSRYSLKLEVLGSQSLLWVELKNKLITRAIFLLYYPTYNSLSNFIY